MGTLGNQLPRKTFRVTLADTEGFIERAIELSKKHGIDVDTVVRAKHALELERQNDIAVESGDYKDEQAGGIGEILSRIADALENAEMPIA